MTVTAPALRYHGAKFRLAPWIMSFFPSHRCYVEPFGGAAGVLLQKPRAYAEVYNDLDDEITNFFRVLREQPDALIEQIQLTPYARAEFDLAYESTTCPIERARRTAVRVERLQDISEADALAEGIRGYPFRPDDGWPICTGYTHLPDDGACGLWPTAKEAFSKLWTSTGGDWDANPWVWAIDFKVLSTTGRPA